MGTELFLHYIHLFRVASSLLEGFPSTYLRHSIVSAVSPPCQRDKYLQISIKPNIGLTPEGGGFAQCAQGSSITWQA